MAPVGSLSSGPTRFNRRSRLAHEPRTSAGAPAPAGGRVVGGALGQTRPRRCALWGQITFQTAHIHDKCPLCHEIQSNAN